MNIMVLSDLHIDTSDKFGTFQWNELELMVQIEKMRDLYSIEKVIFNGDTFELLKYRFDEIEKANSTLLRYFHDQGFVFIKGNHDIVNTFGVDHFPCAALFGELVGQANREGPFLGIAEGGFDGGGEGEVEIEDACAGLAGLAGLG